MQTPPSFLTFWGHMGVRNVWLSFGVACLGIGFLVDAGLRIRDVVRGRDVHIVASCTSGVSRPGDIPPAVAKDYAEKWFQNRLTFTDDTIDDVHASVRRSLDPRLGMAFGVQAREEAKEIKKAKMTSQAIAHSPATTILDYTSRRVLVQSSGIQTILIGSEEVLQEAVTLTLTLEPTVNAGIPAGLIVTRVQEPSPIKFLKR